jgi:AraC-like DNA-binding protein
MNLGLYDLFLFIGLVQGTALTIILFLKKFQRHRFLAIIIAILTFSSLVSFLWRSNLIIHAPHLLGVTMPLLFLLGPCYYFYIKSLFGEPYGHRTAALHFLPGIITVLSILPFYIKSGETKLSYILNTSPESIELPIGRAVAYGLLMLHLAGYLILTYRYLSVLKPGSYRHFNHWRNWANTLQFGLISIAIIHGVVSFLYIFTPVKTAFYRDILNLAVTFFIHLIAFGMIYQTNLADKPGSPKRAVQYSEDLIRRVSRYIETEKWFLNSNLKLSELAKVLDLTPQKLSELINQYYGKSFTELTNEYRVRESKRVLLEQKYEIYDMDGIARLSGFQSRTNLTRVFKKHTGITPSEFKNRQATPPSDLRLTKLIQVFKV